MRVQATPEALKLLISLASFLQAGQLQHGILILSSQFLSLLDQQINRAKASSGLRTAIHLPPR